MRLLLPAAGQMDRAGLRDDAEQILRAVAKDLLTPQTREAQSEKSKGRAPKLTDAKQTAAQTHALLRARGGFDIRQLTAEYRAAACERPSPLDGRLRPRFRSSKRYAPLRRN